MIPFARTAAERRADGGPRPSLEERYGSHNGYVEKVRTVERRLLLPEGAQALVGCAQ